MAKISFIQWVIKQIEVFKKNTFNEVPKGINQEISELASRGDIEAIKIWILNKISKTLYQDKIIDEGIAWFIKRNIPLYDTHQILKRDNNHPEFWSDQYFSQQLAYLQFDNFSQERLVHIKSVCDYLHTKKST
jgi:hypothetical protein